jgi:hypothetical protein
MLSTKTNPDKIDIAKESLLADLEFRAYSNQQHNPIQF